MRSWGGKAVTSSPKKRIVPEVGRKSPVMQLNSVVLPAPLEPSTARRSPGRTDKVTSVSAASAPNSRVTPRSSSALPAPTAERRCATLSMAAGTPGRIDGARPATAPALPKPDHAVGREEHDSEEADSDQHPEPVAVEAEAHQHIESKRLEHRIDQSADERSDRIGDS